MDNSTVLPSAGVRTGSVMLTILGDCCVKIQVAAATAQAVAQAPVVSPVRKTGGGPPFLASPLSDHIESI